MMTRLPPDVIDHVRRVFTSCNVVTTRKLTMNPNVQEEALDLTWVDEVMFYTTPLQTTSGWFVKIEAHYLGGLRHYENFEIADIGVRLPVEDPERRIVIHMCLCAHDIATGTLPGPYTDAAARRYARGCLLAPGLGELLERHALDVSRTAHALGIPGDELHFAIAEHRERAGGVSDPWPRLKR